MRPLDEVFFANGRVYELFNPKNEIMTDKWNKIRILTEWLEQGRTIEIEDVSYGISENGDILHMYCEDKGVPLPSLTHIWNLIDKLDDSRIFIMSSEVALTKMNREKAAMRVK